MTDEIAAGLRHTGMVTAAIWSDVDGDEAIDLITTHEWGAIRVWRNRDGRLQHEHDADGMSRRSGWWNGIASGDFDHDGDTDYVATNWGWNTKYHASLQHPTELYYGDFDGTGHARIIEAEYENETLFPMRGRSCSSRAMPFVSEKFGSFKAFASASLDEIYTPKCLAESERFEANTLASGVWLNDGVQNGVSVSFRFLPLPPIAQISPSFGVAVAEMNGDQHLDICIAQNFYQPQWETGRMDSGLSSVLLGNGDGTFSPMSPGDSGLIVPADATGITATDLNSDGRTDLIVSVNDGDVMAFVNHSRRGANFTGNTTKTKRETSGAQQFSEARVKAGIQFAINNKRPEALSAYRQAFLADPTNLQAATRLGEASADGGNLKDAEWYFQQAMAIHGNTADAHRGLGRVEYLKGFFEKAEAHFDKAMSLNPKDTATRLNLANTLLARNQSLAAITAFHEILKEKPDMAHAWYGMGIALDQEKRTEQAAAALIRAARLNPEFSKLETVASKVAMILCKHGEQLASKRKHQAALARFSQAANALPTYAPAYAESGHIWLARGNRQKAIAAYQKACSLKTEDWSVWNNVAWLLATQPTVSKQAAHDSEGAARHAVELEPNRASSHDTLGVALAAQGKFAEAKQPRGKRNR